VVVGVDGSPDVRVPTRRTQVARRGEDRIGRVVRIAVAVTVVEPLEPRFTVKALGAAARLKSGVPPLPAAPTVNEAIAVLQLTLKKALFLVKYSLTYQNVVSSSGSMRSAV